MTAFDQTGVVNAYTSLIKRVSTLHMMCVACILHGEPCQTLLACTLISMVQHACRVPSGSPCKNAHDTIHMCQSTPQIDVEVDVACDLFRMHSCVVSAIEAYG